MVVSEVRLSDNEMEKNKSEQKTAASMTYILGENGENIIFCG